MIIDIFNEKFPYMVVDDYYNEEELRLIWEELDFLSYPHKLKRATKESGGATDNTGKLLKKNFHRYIDEIYCERENFDFRRIIFLNPIDHTNNLRRISTFNLYLDTYPYNGHTGISDSLFQSCVPTISFTGNSFASRVSYSLLCSLQLQKLATFNEKEFLKAGIKKFMFFKLETT